MRKRLSLFLTNDFLVSIAKKGNLIVWGLLSTVFLNRALSPELRGEYAYYTNIVSIVVVVYGWGLSTAYPNFIRRGFVKARETFMTYYLLQWIVLIILAMSWGITSGKYQLMILGGMTACSVLATQTNGLLLVESVKRSAAVSVISSVTNAVLLCVMLFVRPKDLLIAYVIYVVKELMVAVGSIILAKVRVSRNVLNWETFKTLLSMGFVPMLTNILIVVNYRIDVILLQLKGIDFHIVGLYAVGVALAEYSWVIPDAFKDVIINRTAREKAIPSITLSLRFSTTFLTLVFLILVITARPLIILAYGADFTEAYGVTLVVFAGVFSMVYTKIIGASYLADGRWLFYFFVLLAAAVLNVLLNLLLIPYWGMYASAGASVATYSVAGGCFVVSFLRKNSLRTRDIVIVRKDDLLLVKKMLQKLWSR